jgi:TolB-like protein/DNA-binding winged helix-turn-helix (wHTH) protein
MVVSDRYAFGDFVLERSQQRVLRSDGSELSLTPRLFSALLLFVEHADTLLDKDTLMLALWPGLVVEENNLSQTISGLRRALGDEPSGSRYIRTVSRRGFRFIAAVTVVPDAGPIASPLPVVATSPASPASPVSTVADRRRRLGLVLAGGIATGLGGVGWWAWRRKPTPATDATTLRATLAVLPFKPLAAESRDELLEVGMADSLITRLSTVPGLVVRSVGSVHRYAGVEQDAVQAARDLDVAWIVDGSLQRRGDQLRVSARLLRAADGTAAWSDSFDEKFTGVFDMQDAISNRVMQALAPRLATSAGGAAGARLTDVGGTRNTDAYQLYLSASRQLQSRSANGARRAIELFNTALTFDPAYALAYVGLAAAHRETLLAADAVPAEVFESAKAAARRALALAPNLAEALTEEGFGLYYFEFDGCSRTPTTMPRGPGVVAWCTKRCSPTTRTCAASRSTPAVRCAWSMRRCPTSSRTGSTSSSASPTRSCRRRARLADAVLRLSDPAVRRSRPVASSAQASRTRSVSALAKAPG